MVGRTVSHYRVLALLGGGGMGVVYRAEDVRLGRSVALKFLPERLADDSRHLERFKVEARIASGLNHPNICSIHDVGEFEGRPYLVMEYLEGATLKDRAEAGGLSLDEATTWVLEVTRGLDAAHAQGIIHRDLKPANIFLTVEGRIKILDFGVAKLVRTDLRDTVESAAPTWNEPVTGTGVLMGTVGYMSPEQVRGDPLDARTDLFSLGVVFYQLCSGEAPFAGPTPAVVASRILTQPPVPPSSVNSQVPAELERLILKLLDKDPAKRYQSAREVIAELEVLRRRLDPAAASISPSLGRIRPRPVSHRLGSLPRLALLILIVVLAVLFVARRVDWSPIPEQKHLVVLPFSCMGEPEHRTGFCDGLVQILTSRLSRLEQPEGALLVVPATEVFSEGITNAAQAGRRYGVNLAVSGIVWCRPDGAQVALNLIDVRRGRQIGSAETFSDWERVPALLEWAVGEVAVMIRLGVSPGILTSLAAGTSGVPQAEDFYVQGRGYLSRADKAGNIDLAVALFERALALDPHYARGHAALGEAYWKRYTFTHETRWIESARASIHRALELDPSLAEARVALGVVYRGTGRYEEAAREFLEVLAARPADGSALVELARAYESLGDLERAEATYRKAIELRTGDWNAYQQLGYFLYFQGRVPEAIEAFEHVLQLTPDSYVAHNDLGVCHLILGKRDEAERAFFRSIAAEPNNLAYTNLGTIHFQKGDFRRAADLYAEAVELSRGDYQIWGNLAAARRFVPGEERAAGEAYARAAALAEEKRRVDPRDPLVAAHLAVYYAELGREMDSRSLLDEVTETAPHNIAALHEVINAYEILGDREKVLVCLREAVKRGYRLERVEKSPAFESLRSDERYRRLKAEMEREGIEQ